MITNSTTITAARFREATGWEIKPVGACKGDRCVPLPGMDPQALDIHALGERMRMPVVHDEPSGLWALGPESGGNALQTAEAPELTLPEFGGGDFTLSSLRGQKVLLLAWASW